MAAYHEMDWDKLRIFHAVADAGSLTHAGDVLHLSQSAVSRQIRALEESLGTTLFHRHARGLILTEQGELLSTLQRAIADEGIDVLAIPWLKLVVFVLLAALAGVVAAALPARRAARLDVLRAIGTE